MKKFVLCIVAAALCAGVLAGCGEKPPQESLRLGVKSVGWLHPLYSANPLNSLLFDSLMVKNAGGGYEASLAANYSISGDGRVLTFVLKPGLKFSDGKKLTVRDVVFSYNVISDSSYDGQLKALAAPIAHIDAIDELTVEFTFKEGLRANLESCTLPIAPMHYYGKDYSAGQTQGVKAVTTPLGSGAYRLVDYAGGELTLSLNMRYHSAGDYRLGRLVVVEGEPTGDKVGKTVDLYPALANAAGTPGGGAGEKELPHGSYTYLAVNCSAGPLGDAALRRAMFMVVDREAMLAAMGQHGAEYVPQPSFAAQGTWAAGEDALYSGGAEQAVKLLEEGGWRLNEEGVRQKDGERLTVKLVVAPGEADKVLAAEYLKDMWMETLGVEVLIAYYRADALEEYIASSPQGEEGWGLAFMRMDSPVSDPDALRVMLNNPNPLRYGGGPAAQALAGASGDYQAKKGSYEGVFEALREDAALLPLYTTTQRELYVASLQGYTPSAYQCLALALRGVALPLPAVE